MLTRRALTGSMIVNRSGSSIEPRYGTFAGRQCLICPVIAVRGGIVWRPMGSHGMEYVPSEVLARTAQGWNNRPVVLNHPSDLTANTISFLESAQLGTIFDAGMSNGDLSLNAWMSEDLCKQVGDEGNNIYSKCLANEECEVSIGCLAQVRLTPGIAPDGTPYDAIWEAIIIQDHLAVLPVSVGACSIDKGCGMNRAAADVSYSPSDALVLSPYTAEAPTSEPGIYTSTRLSNGGTKMNIFAKFMEMISGNRSALEDRGLSIDSLEYKLSSLLFSAVPAFSYVIDVFPDSQTVVYRVTPNGEWLSFRRSYTVSGPSDNQVVTLNDDEEAVEYTGEWKTVSATADSPVTAPLTNVPEPVAVTASSCPCQQPKEVSMPVNPVSAPAPVVAATDPESTPVTAPVTVAAQPVTTDVPAQPADLETFLSTLPKQAADTFRAAIARDEVEKQRLVTVLSSAQNVYSADELKSKDLPELIKLSALTEQVSPRAAGRTAAPTPIRPIDYSAHGARETAVREDNEVAELPDTFGLRKAKAAALASK